MGQYWVGANMPGVPVVQQVTSERKVTVETTPHGTPAWDGPLAILIGRRSAAATEITAAAIQDYGRGLVIGDVSYGRGSVQTLVNLAVFQGSGEAFRRREADSRRPVPRGR